MQTPINFWLWRYESSRKRYGGYHLFADKTACELLLTHLTDPDFRKISLSLRTVHPNMPLILTPADIKYIAFDRLRIFRDHQAQETVRWEEDGSSLDLYTNGKERLAEGLGYMREGQWDFRMESISYWGLLSEAEYRKQYSNSLQS